MTVRPDVGNGRQTAACQAEKIGSFKTLISDRLKKGAECQLAGYGVSWRNRSQYRLLTNPKTDGVELRRSVQTNTGKNSIASYEHKPSTTGNLEIHRVQPRGA